jgi:hypothetical protein
MVQPPLRFEGFDASLNKLDLITADRLSELGVRLVWHCCWADTAKPVFRSSAAVRIGSVPQLGNIRPARFTPPPGCCPDPTRTTAVRDQ